MTFVVEADNMDKRLIDTNEYPCRSSKCGISYCYQRCDKFWDWLERNPPIDAVEIIRCRDCRFLIDRNDGTYGCYRHFADECKLDDYCSYGERRHEKD